MRHADWSTAPLTPTAPTAPTSPTAPLGGGSGFGGVFRQVQDEVTEMIRNGDAGAAPRLTAEGSVWRARAEAAPGVSLPGVSTPEQQAFLDSIAPWAREAGEKLGVAPELVSAHAALESGWGQRPLRTASGASSHNLFGIKASADWPGAVSESATTEYLHGEALRTSARFRAYPDQASAFRDYADLLLSNPRFRGALGAGSDAHAFAQGLARGGYATDPGYADKLARVAGRLKGISG
ncbi:glycoside hydrolase family 73 protein [Massilia horti]|uniref:Flagellar assembly peptidoglycan hydrolase FlgJ n=1 Tax=Massilia horti TaxID=2562153 RepID=A0A4Y9SY89_9BURK|nr:glucosaminidase domain-containing protein [Massilia horti]TFW29696.1 flagellar assembly peptidoglycan hydrolase FlgJ [Massilia horti]